ncbi:ribonuclease P protein component [Candidatus Ishikawella capsulata]|uniref:Ribonuclease P protein component n=1 Tax=Candidatus Ishikawaella capsulata Mpkobe TaxID=476281 RepID=C5WC30_9ENTR|nr:ribonuclease P protein component [Candidatus Ishikawaella capsulata]BAH82886.1 ribonuclease P [Candidatus Ishikawaella capsulata Mpkobe]
MGKLNFSKELRLLTASDFSFVFQEAKRASCKYITIFGRKNLFRYPRIGFAISKKNIKFAHDRNRIKRITRETFRKMQYKLPIMDFVIIAKIGVIHLENNELRGILEKLWHYHRRLVRGL